LRIAFISTWKAPCGISTYTKNLAGELAKKHDVMVFAEDREISGYDDSQNSNIAFRECWNRYTGFWRLLDELRRFEPDIVHVQHEFSLFYKIEQTNRKFLEACRQIAAPLVITYHTIPIPAHRYWTPPENRVQKILLDRGLRSNNQRALPALLRREIAAFVYEPAVRHFFEDSNGIFARKIVHNKAMQSIAATRYGLSNVVVINHGVTTYTPLDMMMCRRKLGIPEDSIVITSFGFVSESKGLLELIEVIRDFEESEVLPVRFYHVGGLHGTGIGKSYMEQCLRKVETMDSIKLTGYIPEEELPVYYSASDMFILNYSPGTGASASGCVANLIGTKRPLLTTLGTNRTDEIDHNHNCVKVPYNDKQALLSALRNLILDVRLRSKIVERANEYAKENSWDKIARKHEELYREVIRKTTSSSRSAFTGFGSSLQTYKDFTLSIPGHQKQQRPPLTSYLKRAENKPQPNGIRNVDFIYVISLDKKRFSRTARQLSQYSILPYRFEAVEGFALAQEIIDQLGTPTFCEEMSRKQLGIIVSHLSVLQDAYESGYETIWVMEDDVEVIQNPRVLSGLIDELDGFVRDWDLLYTDIESKDRRGKLVPRFAITPRPNFPRQRLAYYSRRKRLSSNFTEIGMRYGSYSMIIRRSGIKKILNHFEKYRIYLPYDLDLYLVPELKQISCTHEVVSHMSKGLLAKRAAK